MRAAIAGLVTVVALAGCTARPAPLPTRGAAGPLPTEAALSSALAARRTALHGLRAWARLSYTSPDESRRAKQLLVVERPDRLRFEVFSPFGAVFVLTAADGALAAWDRGEAVVYRGTASAENLDRYVQVDLPVPTAVDLLLATPPLAAGPGVVSADGDAIKLWQETSSGVTATWFAADTLDPLRVEHQDAEGRVRLRTVYDTWSAIDGVRLPSQVAIELPASQRRIGVELSEIEINPTLGDAVFALATPAGSREVALDAQGDSGFPPLEKGGEGGFFDAAGATGREE
ncbi:MAG: DUF4292 domain-containing protein [Deltaproteobacteria bacterium]|nr:DUF4292 domain-containing protein [Deltaproteobacteria bacterium]